LTARDSKNTCMNTYHNTYSSNGTVTFNPLTPPQRALSDEVISYFITFAATGNPNAPHPASASASSHNSQATLGHSSDAQEHVSPTWPAYDSGKRLVFRAVEGGTGSTRGMKGGSYVEELDGGEIERCKVWESLTDTLQI
jgi:hypothetical protein